MHSPFNAHVPSDEGHTDPVAQYRQETLNENGPPLRVYVNRMKDEFTADVLSIYNFIVSEVSLERFEKLDLFFGFSCFTLHFSLFGVRFLKEFIMSSSEGTILNSSSSRLRLLHDSSLSSDSGSALESSWVLWCRFFGGIASGRTTMVFNREAIVPIFALICESVFASVSPGWLLDRPASEG